MKIFCGSHDLGTILFLNNNHHNMETELKNLVHDPVQYNYWKKNENKVDHMIQIQHNY